MSQNITSPEDQSATFIELFFDLVFVFSVTQIVYLFHDGVTWPVVGQSILVFWLVWWAWTQFTWALNAADTTHPFVEFGTLLATGLAFMMAVTLPEAFAGRALWFAVPYVLVRIVGLWLYVRVASGNEQLHRRMVQFGVLSVGGMAAVLLGAWLGGSGQAAVWGLVVVLDVVAAVMSAQGDEHSAWGIHPEHFSERHGLFIIIALGETLIVAAGGMSGAEWTLDLVVVGLLSVVLSCALWWSYFVRAKPVLDHAFEHHTRKSELARDAFTLLHFPMMCGVIGYAVAVEEAVLHPEHALPLAGRWALALGIGLFLGGMAAAIWRASGRALMVRIGVTLAAGAAIVLLPGSRAYVSFSIAALAVVVVVVIEQGQRQLDLT